MKRWLSAALALATLIALAPRARAFCRTTTCDPNDPEQHCQRENQTQCLLTGEPVYWASDCLTISVQADGAPRSGIDYADAKASVERAFASWMQVDCGGGQSPSINVVVEGPVECRTSEYNKQARNANIVMFHDESWPYEGAEDALGLTRVRFDLEQSPGALWDADIEVNAFTEPLSVGQARPGSVDLDSLLTHEAGHVLGLGHTLDPEASMIAGYVTGSDDLRSLGQDDVDGICAIYPPSRSRGSTSCEPRHGFSELCAADQPDEPAPPAETDEPQSKGCAFAAPKNGGAAHASVLAALALLAGLGRRRVARPCPIV